MYGYYKGVWITPIASDLGLLDDSAVSLNASRNASSPEAKPNNEFAK